MKARDKRYPGVTKFLDKRGERPVWRWRARAKGKPTGLIHGAYGSPQFTAEWEAWATGKKLEIGKSRSAPGSVSALIAGYYDAPEFRDELASSTQKAYRAVLERFREKNGTKTLEIFTPEGITAKRDGMRPDPSNMFLRVIRHLCRYAVARKMLLSDPTAGLRKVRVKTDGIHSWTLEEVEQFERHTFPSAEKPNADLTARARLALALLLYTAQRKGDVVTFGRQHETAGGTWLKVRQAKTGEWLELPIVAPLRAAIDAAPAGSLTYLETAQGRPFTANGFGNWFRDRCDEAGLPQCSAHGLRKAAATRLADNGKSAHEIQAITGHRSLSEVQRYTRAADQKRLARAAAGALIGSKPERSAGNVETLVAKSK